MGQPSILTPEVRSRILAHLQTGIAAEKAALASGVSQAAHYNWQKRGRAERQRRAEEGYEPDEREDRYVEYVEALDAARAAGEAYLAGQVSRAAGPRQVTITRTRSYPRKHRGGGEVLDEAGNPVMVTETTVETREEFDWRAAAWMLERLNPETWAAVTRTELTGRDGGPVQVEQVREQALALIDELRLRRSVPAQPALGAAVEGN